MRRTVLTVLAVLASASSAQAQERRANTPPPAAPAPAKASRPRVAYAGTVTPTPEQQRQVPVQVAQPVYYYTPDGYLISAPYIGLSDGSVLVNFGPGYERVLRACTAVRSPTQSDPWAKDVLGRIPPPPGIAAIQAGSRGQVLGNTPPRNAQACYRSDASGRVNVVTF